MEPLADIQETTLTSVVSMNPSFVSDTHPHDFAPKHSMLMRRMTSVDRKSIAEDAPATLSFHNINYIVGTKGLSSKWPLNCSTLSFLKPQDPKKILSDVSGNFVNGMNAILGKTYFSLKIVICFYNLKKALLDVESHRYLIFWLIEKLHVVYLVWY